MGGQLVLVGRFGDDVRAFGPFDEPDDAREFANTLAMGEMIRWDIVPLTEPF